MKIPRYGKLSARLRELGLSQTDLAYALRLSPGAISQRMQGTGSGVTGRHIDLCAGSHEEALQMGRRTATVYWVDSEGG